MAAPARKRSNQRRSRPKRPVVDIWNAPAELPPVEPISIPSEVGALLQSLGEPPLSNPTAAGHYFTAVVERSAAVARALAFAAGVIDEVDAR